MKNMKFWRTALVATLVLTVMLSVTGGTIAWFTDSVESGANVIKAGNLDVELYRSTTNVAEEKVTTSTKLFTVPTLWEPGAVAYENLRVANEGDLYLYFDLGINFANVNTVAAADGTVTEYGLDDVLKVAVVEDGVSGNREDMLAAAQDAGGKTLGSLVEKQSLAPGASKTYGVIIYWEPSANDNNWNLNNGKETSDGAEYLNIDLGVELFATQFNYEPDSFGPDYDANAKVTVYDAAGLKAALEEGGTVILGNNIVVDENLTIPEGKAMTLDLNGQTLSKSEDTGLVIRNYGSLALTGEGTIDGTMGGYAVRNEPGSELTVNDGVVIDGGFGAVSSFGGKLTINGGDFSNEEKNVTHYVVYATDNSTVVINDGTFTFGNDQYASANGSPILAATNGSTIEINGGTFDAGNGSALCYDANNIVIKGGTFKNRATVTYGGTIEGKVADGYKVTKADDGTWTVSRNAQNVEATENREENTQALANAINGATAEQPFINLGAGEYEMPEPNMQGKTLTFTGTKDTVIDMTAVNANDQFVTGADLVFEGVTLNFGKDNYMGLANTASLTYKNCTINGLQFLYGANVQFENCDFNSNGAEHSVWTYGAQNVSFTDCDFVYGDRSINCYGDNDVTGGKQTVNFKNCTFTTDNASSEGAVEINSSHFSVGIEVNLEGCTAPAYGEMAYVSRWDSTYGAKTKINIK